MNKTATRCDNCRRRFEAPCRDNPSCGIQGSHKHCQLCYEPIRRRWDELCRFCEAEREKMNITVAEFKLLAYEQNRDVEVAA